ncbi:hypothetical protein D3C85_1194940 [compost metagenome]
MPIDSILGLSWPLGSPSSYKTSNASFRYWKNCSPVLKPCGVAKRMSLESSVYGTTRCGFFSPPVTSTSVQKGRSSP